MKKAPKKIRTKKCPVCGKTVRRKGKYCYEHRNMSQYSGF